MKKNIICSVKLNKQQYEYIERYMHSNNLETISQTLRAIINDNLINKPMKAGAEDE